MDVGSGGPGSRGNHLSGFSLTRLGFLQGSEPLRLVDSEDEESCVLGCAGRTLHPVDGAR